MKRPLIEKTLRDALDYYVDLGKSRDPQDESVLANATTAR